MIYRLPIRVYYEDTDMGGIVYYANYLKFIERGRSEWVREIGLDQHEMKADGVTIILTTHYIEEAEAIADRIGVITRGELLLVQEKAELMRQMGRKQLEVQLNAPIETLPASLADFGLEIGQGGETLIYSYDTHAERTGITKLLNAISDAGLTLRDVQTRQSSLEDIFVNLVEEDA